MNKSDINSIAMKINAGGEAKAEDIYKLCNVAGLSYETSFKGLESVTGDSLNQLLSLAHQAVKEQEEANKSNERVRITHLNELAKQAQPIKTNDQLYDEMCVEVWKSRNKS